MMIVPFQISKTEYSIVVLLENDNMERIREHDPAEITIKKLPPEWTRLKLNAVLITYLGPEEKDRFLALCDDDRVQQALRFATRGWRYRPDQGDHDHGPERVFE